MANTERDRRGTVFLVEEDLDEGGAGGGVPGGWGTVLAPTRPGGGSAASFR